MNSPLTPAAGIALRAVALDDKYTVDDGRIYLSGVQMLSMPG
jgi:indolepyruvate ferredoxin oxidoreductase